MTQQHQSLYLKLQIKHHVVATEEMCIRSPSPGAPYISSIHRCITDWLGSPGFDHCSGEKELNISILEMKAAQTVLECLSTMNHQGIIDLEE